MELYIIATFCTAMKTSFLYVGYRSGIKKEHSTQSIIIKVDLEKLVTKSQVKAVYIIS